MESLFSTLRIVSITTEKMIDFYLFSDYNANRPLSDKMEVQMENMIIDQLAVFNQLYKEMDEIYHLYAKKQGISDTALWLLYSLYEKDATYTQRELCSAWHYPPQTINSALKNLEKQEFICLTSIPGNKKNKLVLLTEKGKKLTENVISRLVLSEQQSFQALSKEERKSLLVLTQKYTELLRIEINELLNSYERKENDT